MRAFLKHPWILVASSGAVIILSFVCFSFLETDLLPEMDEGGFILDYDTPPGSSLAETERILQRIEEIIRSQPEVENTSRRTGLQLGLAAVTEANRGDFTVNSSAIGSATSKKSCPMYERKSNTRSPLLRWNSYSF